MATASELKSKVTKILTIIEYLDDEHINLIEKDILLQAVRELYSDILVTGIEISEAESHVSDEGKEPEENVAEIPVENVETPSEPPVIAIPFDTGDFDFHDLLDMNNDAEKADETAAIEDNPQNETPVETIEEPIPETADEPITEEAVEMGNLADNAEETFEMPEEKADEFVDETNATDIPDEVVDSEYVAETPAEHTDETPAEEPKFENEYFSQNESVSSDYSDSVSTIEEPVEEIQQEETFEPSAAEEPIAEVVSEEITEPKEEPATEEIFEPSPEEEPTVEAVPEEIAEPVEETAIAEEPVEVAPEVVPEPATVETQATPVEPVHQESEPEKVITLGEQLGQSRQESLNDKFANNKSADLSSSIGLKPISDIKSSIPLGERFLFTRTLFSGSGALFESTVAALNEMSSMEEAEGYIRANFNWDMESSTVANFMNIVRRRYL